MSHSIAARGLSEVLPLLRRYGPMVALFAGTYLLGVAGQSVGRPLFMVGCVAVSWDLMRFGVSTHFAGSFAMFCVAPFLRRVIDVYAGYEPSGMMVSGPLLAIAVTAPSLLNAFASGQVRDPAMRPFVIVFACTIYGALLTVIDGSLMLAASNAVKWFPPLTYGMWIYTELRYGKGARHDGDVLAPVTGVAMVLMPLLGLYGLLQFVDPPMWDRFWMINTTIASIGQPEPFMVRVFSTMNAPAGYATFTTAALLMFGFRKIGPSLLLAAGPATLGLLLTMYRTAWIGLAAGILLGLLSSRTRGRAIVLLLAVPILGAAAIVFTPAGDQLQQRLETFGSVSDDGSGQERLAEFGALLNADGGTLIGHGFDSTDVLQAGSLALDGEFIICWFVLGLVVGIICTVAVAWAGIQGMVRAWRADTLTGLAVTGILAALLVQMPLAMISRSEIGFLFWSLAGIGAATRPAKPP